MKKTKVFITGATGNVGLEVINALNRTKHDFDIYAGLRNINTDKGNLSNSNVQLAPFDFTDLATYKPALEGCDILFLLRPPQISEVEKYFKPLLQTCITEDVKHIVFLSVQGVEKSTIIPHHKIEQLIVDSKIAYTFLRPAYFMQNFTTTLNKDLIENKLIYLPAGKAKFTLVDVRDIGEVTTKIITNVSLHVNKTYELTCKEKFTFAEMTQILSINLGTTIQFESPNLINFFWRKKQEKMPIMLILVMIMLHYLPRFQKEPEITDWVEKIIKRLPITFEQFIKDNRALLVK